MFMNLTLDTVRLILKFTDDRSAYANMLHTCTRGRAWAGEMVKKLREDNQSAREFCELISTSIVKSISRNTLRCGRMQFITAHTLVILVSSMHYRVEFAEVDLIVDGLQNAVCVSIKYMPKTLLPCDPREETSNADAPVIANVDFDRRRAVVRIRGDDVSQRIVFRFDDAVHARAELCRVLSDNEY
jgi:hypothetical protein